MFFVWGLFALVLFATNDPSIVLFFWSLTILVEILLYAGSFYLSYVFFAKKDLTFNYKIIILVIILPFIIFLGTRYNIKGVDLNDCTASEGIISLYYSYIVEALFSLLIITTSFIFYKKTDDINHKSEIKNFTIGIIIFLIIFSSGNILGSFTDNWVASQYGYFGMPIFVTFLAYLIVKFQTFDVKIIATQALVWGTALLIGAQIFTTSGTLDLVITIITFVVFVVFGIFLVKSVKREVEQRQKIEQLASQRENFIHFLSHEVKGILGKNLNMFSVIIDKNSGVNPEQLQSFAQQSLTDTRGAVEMVENILHSNEVKGGKISFDMKPFDMKSTLLEAVESFKTELSAKGLSLEVKIPENQDYTVLGDKENISQHVIRNMIDNSIKYTQKGGLLISLVKQNNSVFLSIKDTGVGITKEDMANLFTEGGHGKDSVKINVHSTGYGLFFAKGIVSAHNGKIWAESEGEGKGSTFILELLAK